MTLNKRLFTIAKPYLEPLSKTKRDEAYFENLFGKFDPDYMYELGEEHLKQLDLTDSPISVPAKPREYLDYLDLKGDLSWFEDIVKEDKVEVEGVPNCDQEGLDKLVEITARLGLTLPTSFIKLLKNQDLTDKLPSGSAWYIEFSDLYKIRIHRKDDISQYVDGYIFTWFSDQQGCYYTNMYLDKQGRHAVLGSPWNVTEVSDDDNSGLEEEKKTDLAELTEEDKREGIGRCASYMAENQQLYDVDFERWLVNHYYSQRLAFDCWTDDFLSPPDDSDDDLDIKPEHIKRYLANVFTEEGRRMQ